MSEPEKKKYRINKHNERKKKIIRDTNAQNDQIFYSAGADTQKTDSFPDRANDKRFRMLLVDRIKSEIKAGTYDINLSKFKESLKKAIRDIDKE